MSVRRIAPYEEGASAGRWLSIFEPSRAALALFALTPFVLLRSYESPERGQIAFFESGAFFLLALFSLRRLVQQPRPIAIDIVLICAAGELAARLASALRSPDRAYSVSAWLFPAAGFAFFLLLRGLDSQLLGRAAARILAVQAAILSIWGLAEAAGFRPLDWSSSITKSSVVASLGHPNFLASFLAPAVFVLMARAFDDRSGSVERLLSGASGALAIATIVAAHARAAQAGLAGGALLFAVGFIFSRRHRILRALAASNRLRFVIVAVVVVAALGCFFLVQVVSKRFGEEKANRPGTLDSRMAYWWVAAEMAGSPPSILGVGPGGFGGRFWAELERREAGGGLFARNIESMAGETGRSRNPDHAHSDYLEILVEGGAVALFFRCLLLLWILASTFVRLAGPPGTISFARLAIPAALLGGLAATAIDATLGFPWCLPASSALFWLLIVVTANESRGEVA